MSSNVVDACRGRHVQDLLDDPAADVGGGHRRAAGARGRRRRWSASCPAACMRTRGSRSPSGLARASAMARSGSRTGSSGSLGYTTRLPTGSFSRRSPSPWWNRIGGVVRSTSSTRPLRAVTVVTLQGLHRASTWRHEPGVSDGCGPSRSVLARTRNGGAMGRRGRGPPGERSQFSHSHPRLSAMVTSRVSGLTATG